MSTVGSWTTYDSPLGELTLRDGRRGLTALHFPGDEPPRAGDPHEPALFTDAVGQLDEYFAGRRRQFALALDLEGTAFQRLVWSRLRAIPYGATVTYGALAQWSGGPVAPGPPVPPWDARPCRSSCRATACWPPTAR